MTARPRPPGAADFDFLMGEWRVSHRRLDRRLAGADKWTEFPGTMRARPILEGLGNFDENVLEMPGGRYEACTVRMFDPATGLWSIRWIDGRDPRLDPPVTGRFEGGEGRFEGDDHFEGRPIRVAFHWSRSGPDQATWSQAFSADAGRTWETNWIMRFHRP